MSRGVRAVGDPQGLIRPNFDLPVQILNGLVREQVEPLIGANQIEVPQHKPSFSM